MVIDRCVCQDMTFAMLLQKAREEKLTFEQLVRSTGCGLQCGSCLAYIKHCLETGKTVLTEPLPFSAETAELHNKFTLRPNPPKK